MKIGFLSFLLTVSLAALECGGGSPPPSGGDGGSTTCDAFNCNGCCTTDGRCVAGTSAAACGQGGDLCVTCDAPAQCASQGTGGGVCEGCSAFNCDGCCTSDGICVAGTADEECGYAGQRCVACTGLAYCDPRGVGGGICR